MQGFARIINDEYRLYLSTSDPWTKSFAYRDSSFLALNSKVGLIVDNSTLIMRAGVESKFLTFLYPFQYQLEPVDWTENDNSGFIQVLDLALPAGVIK